MIPPPLYKDKAYAFLGKNSKGKMCVNKIELNPKADAPKDLASKVSQLLFEWTKIKWHILMTKEKGDPTLEEQNEKLKENVLNSLSKNERIKEILNAFKGAKIEDVKSEGEENE